jgi:hypothetical protein
MYESTPNFMLNLNHFTEFILLFTFWSYLNFSELDQLKLTIIHEFPQKNFCDLRKAKL